MFRSLSSNRHNRARNLFPYLAALAVATMALPLRVLAADGAETSPDGLWTRLDKAPEAVLAGLEWVRPTAGQAMALDAGALRALLKGAPMQGTIQIQQSPVVISLPRPDGTFERFAFVEWPAMEPALQAKYPQIRTYMGQGLDDPGASVAFDLTPLGFHAQVLRPSPDGSAARGAWYIDPLTRDDLTHYTSYWNGALANPAPWTCSTPPGPALPINNFIPRGPGGQPVELRTYRVAVAATGEFTTFFSAPNPPNVSAGLAGVVTTINQVNQIYHIEVAVHLQLVGNDNLVIFTNPITDPYAGDDIGVTQCQNGATLRDFIGEDNFDLGHVFHVAGLGGNAAAVGSACNNSTPNSVGCGAIKSQGFSSSTSPTGPNWIGLVAHEMGHQLGASHSFNSVQGTCGGQISPAAAYEPGSGNTIMSYAGSCGSDSVAGARLPMFSFRSLQDILNYTGSHGCGATSPTGNHTPTCQGTPGPIPAPIKTPFYFDGVGFDSDATDVLSYSWEQMDLGANGPLGPDTGNHEPLFKPHMHGPLAARLYPPVADVLSGTTTPGEYLPQFPRTSQFCMTVRDNNVAGGGVAFFVTTIQFAQVPAAFRITSPTGGAFCSSVGLPVVWDPAGTNGPPFNVGTVYIQVSTDAGQTFQTVATDIVNAGLAIITLPPVATSHARIKVVRLDGDTIPFYAISPEFAIASAAPTVATQPLPISDCPGRAALLHAAAGASQPAILQWRKNGAVLPGQTGEYLPFILTHDDTGDYDCVISNACGTVTTNTVRVQVGVSFDSQPHSPSPLPCQDIVLSAPARGVGPLTYLWTRNGAPIAPDPRRTGMNGPTFTLHGIQYGTDDEGTYTCTVTDSCESRASDSVTLTLPTPAWVQRSFAGPRQRGVSTDVAYDALRHVAVVYGGYSNNPSGSRDGLSDTWEWDGVSWTQRFPAHDPGVRQFQRLVFDTSRNVVLLYGGYGGGNSGDVPPNNEVWGYDGNDWTLLSASTPSGPPLLSQIQYAVFDSARAKMIVITAPPSQTYSNATWEFDSATLTWAPPALTDTISYFNSAFAYDSVHHVTVGQNYIIGQYASTAVTYTWDGAAWTNTGAITPTRDGASMAYDSTRRQTIIYGCCRFGIGYGYWSTDTWAFDGAAWQPLLPNLQAAQFDSVLPLGLVYDTYRRAMVMVGQDYNGSVGTVPEQTWEYRYLDHVVIDRQPQATSAVIGQPAALAVYAAGAGTLTYQWRKNGVNLADGPGPSGSVIAGSHSPALAINPYSAANAGAYDCVIANTCGSVTSAIVRLGNVADFNGDGQKNVADIFAFLSAWFAGDPRADINGDGHVTVTDIFVFLTAWFA